VLFCPSQLMLWIGPWNASAPQVGEASQGMTTLYLPLDVSSLVLAHLEDH
jgi:hypothetical protein